MAPQYLVLIPNNFILFFPLQLHCRIGNKLNIIIVIRLLYFTLCTYIKDKYLLRSLSSVARRGKTEQELKLEGEEEVWHYLNGSPSPTCSLWFPLVFPERKSTIVLSFYNFDRVFTKKYIKRGIKGPCSLVIKESPELEPNAHNIFNRQKSPFLIKYKMHAMQLSIIKCFCLYCLRDYLYVYLYYLLYFYSLSSSKGWKTEKGIRIVLSINVMWCDDCNGDSQ